MHVVSLAVGEVFCDRDTSAVLCVVPYILTTWTFVHGLSNPSPPLHPILFT